MNNSHKTAISRSGASVPVKWAFKSGIIIPDSNIFDWGCGKGADIKWLKKQGCRTIGYDPHYAPENNPNSIYFAKVDVIMCNYVLNVIEDQKVRQELINNILKNASKNKEQTKIIISVRSKKEIEKEAIKNNWISYKDGFLTSKNTFQKGLTELEVKTMVKNNATLECTKNISGGIVFLFKK